MRRVCHSGSSRERRSFGPRLRETNGSRLTRRTATAPASATALIQSRSTNPAAASVTVGVPASSSWTSSSTKAACRASTRAPAGICPQRSARAASGVTRRTACSAR